MKSKPVSSQLGNFIDAASQMESTLEAENSKKQADLESRVQRLNAVSHSMDRIQESLTPLQKAGQTHRILILSQSIGRLRRLQENGLPTGSAKPVRHALNELVSLREAVLAGTSLKKRDFVTSVMTDAILEIRKNHQVASEKLRLMKLNPEGTTLSSKEHSAEEVYRKAEEVISQASSEKSLLEAIGSDPFTITRVPVVPVANPAINPASLKRMGIKCDSIANYPVIYDQVVLGINREALTKNGKTQETAQEAAFRLAGELSIQHKTSFAFVTEKGYPHKGVVWYWLSTKPEINKLSKAANGRLNVQQWGFAF